MYEGEESFPPVSEKSKERIIDWLAEIRLIRKSAVRVEQFPEYCKNGVIFADLIGKILGRGEAVKGIQRKPKNVT